MKRKRSVFSDSGKVFDNPLRLRLLELIEGGIDNVNDMARVLGTNKLNLYHHLNMLEKGNFIRGTYGRERIKTYRLCTDEERQEKQKKLTSTHHTINIVPSDDSRDEITRLVNEILQQSGGWTIGDDKRLLQLTVVYEDREVYLNQMKVMNELGGERRRRAKQN